MIRTIILTLIFLSMYKITLSQMYFTSADSTCTCLEKLLKLQNNKIDFSIGLENCMSISCQDALKLKSSEMVDKYLVTLENYLQTNCPSYNQCLKILDQFSLQSTETKIIDSKNCKILRTGDFEDNSGNERTIVTMIDSIQIVKFEKTGYYTKSRVLWKDDCSFDLLFISSTNPYENLIMKSNDTREVRIIEIKNGTEIILESKYSGRYFISKITKH